MSDFYLLGACGLYCGACYHYRASVPEGAYLLEQKEEQVGNISKYTCSGCRSDKQHIYGRCATCDIRSCVEMKKIKHCGECKELPCTKLVSFQNDGFPHHLDVVTNVNEIKKIGEEQWLAEQKENWTCKCGFSYSWYENSCRNCSTEVSSYKHV